MPKFRKGDRVRINGEYGKWDMTTSGLAKVGQRGTIVGEDRSTPLLWRMLLDGTKTPSTWHHSFLTRIKEE